jgi:hypothetical protein
MTLNCSDEGILGISFYDLVLKVFKDLILVFEF